MGTVAPDRFCSKSRKSPADNFPAKDDATGDPRPMHSQSLSRPTDEFAARR
jgi:hypothetical protein